MANNCKRFLSLLLALVMVIGLMPVGHAHAAEDVFMKIGEQVTEVAENETYVITLHGTMNALTNQQDSGAWGTHTLATSACGAYAADGNMWTLEPAEGGYKLKNVSGYLTISRNTAELNETGHVFELVYHEGAGWAIKSLETSEYGNNLGNTGSIGGWSGDGTKFDLYSLTEVSAEEADPFGKLRGLWTKVSVDTETVYNATEGLFEYAWDNNSGTIWHSNWQGAQDKLTGENSFAGVIDFGQAYVINRFSFTPRVGNSSGQITQASLYVKATEEAEWTLVAEHAAFAANGDKKDIDFPAQEVRYVKFVAEQSSDGWVAVSEFDIDNVEHVHEHSYTGEVTVAPTCTTPGLMTYTCACGEGTYTEEIPATGHQNTVILNARKATLTEEGYTGDTYCHDCQQIVAVGETIPVRQILNAKLQGDTVVALADCAYTFTAEGKLAHVVSDEQTIYIALSGDSGKLPGSASNGDTVTVELPEGATAVHLKFAGTEKSHYLHFYSSTTAGWDRCGNKNLNDHANGTHNVYLFKAIDGFDPDSLIPGYTQVKALEENGQYLIVGAHTNGNYYVMYPTTSGTAADHIAQLVTDEVTHVHSWVDATCTTPKTCSTCGATEGTALGHTEEIIPAVAPTCTETGLTEGKKCTVCGEIIVAQEVVDALGHDFVDGSCSRCGETDPDHVTVIAEGWSGYTTWVLTSDGTITFTSSGEKLENGESNLKNYWKVDGVLELPWGEYAELITKVVINEGIHDIGQMAFYELPNLTEVVLPESVVEIRGYAFKNCKNLTTINLEVVEFIREGAFYGCSALENVSFAEGVVIEDWAFTRTPVQIP